MPNPPSYLRQDMTVSVDIEVARRDDTLALPARSVHDALSSSALGYLGARRPRLPAAGDARPARADAGRDRRRPRGRRLGPADRLRRPHRPAREAVHAVNTRWLPFEWIAAVRFLGEGRLQTAFIVGGISIGVAVIVFMSAMLAGMEANFINRVLTSQSHIQLIPPDQVARPLRDGPTASSRTRPSQRPSQRILSIDQWPKIVARLQAMPEVTAVSPTMSGSALAVRGQASRAITLTGVDPATYYKIVRDARLHRRRQRRMSAARTSSSARNWPKTLGATRRRQDQRPGGHRRAARAAHHRHPRPRQQGRQPAHDLSSRCAPRRR